MKRNGQKQTKENHTRVFLQISDGLQEAIDFERSRGTHRVHFGMEPDLSMDSSVYFSMRVPETTFIPTGLASRDAYGHRYGSELLVLDDAMVERLRNGSSWRLRSDRGEYILYIQYGEMEMTDK